MVAEKAPNLQLLDDYIVKSGLRIGFIAEKLGVTRQAFNYKRRGISRFKASEAYVLCDLLNITGEDKSKIFWPKG